MSKKQGKKGNKSKRQTAPEKEKVSNIMVTIVTVTYNHKDYIRECLDSLVCQKTNFRYQILVGDDCSTDGTADIVREYAAKYPKIIVPVLRRKNVGSMRNFGDLCERAMKQSKYMAFCDGDDFWIDEYKLQKQFDYLERNPKINGTFCRSMMLFDDDYYLKNYYKPSSDGKYYYPECIPDCTVSNNKMFSIHQLINGFCPVPQAVMLRVNKDITFPEWFYDNKYLGDFPIFLINLGKSSFYYMTETMSVYRRNNTGITSYQDTDHNFINTRPEWIKALLGLRKHYMEYYNNFAVVAIENRIKREVTNYLNVLKKYEMTDKIAEFFALYPEAGIIALNAYLSFFNDSQKMTRIYSWEGNKVVARDSRFMYLLKPFVKLYIKQRDFIKSIKQKIKKSVLLKKTRNLIRCILYWTNCIVPKNKKHWAFTSFHNNKYLDNSKYYFEYIADNHPEIKAYWFTKNKTVYNDLKKKGYNVKMINTLSAAWSMLTCSVAVTDHFKMTDYDPLWGLSDKTKIVQLWHGVGLKSMGNGKEVKNTTVPGVQYSSDILPEEGDAFFVKVKKKLKYIRHAYFRELYEKYFLFVCPGQERIDMIGKIWNIPPVNYLMAGHPRNLPVYEGEPTDKNTVLYAPTYRSKPEFEKEMVENFIENVPLIQEFMENNDAYFTLRLHPHTWINYQNAIKKAIFECNRISFDLSPDIYPKMNDYKVIISDYSSIAYDFLMFNKPAVFFCFDYEKFCEIDAGFNLDYYEMTPGPKTFTWSDTLNEVKEYFDNPEKDTEWRKEVCKYFFDKDANSINNSEVITQEIKRRLKIL